MYGWEEARHGLCHCSAGSRQLNTGNVCEPLHVGAHDLRGQTNRAELVQDGEEEA